MKKVLILGCSVLAMVATTVTLATFNGHAPPGSSNMVVQNELVIATSDTAGLPATTADMLASTTATGNYLSSSASIEKNKANYIMTIQVTPAAAPTSAFTGAGPIATASSFNYIAKIAGQTVTTTVNVTDIAVESQAPGGAFAGAFTGAAPNFTAVVLNIGALT